MRNLIIVAIALSILVVFPSMGWAQEEKEEPQQVQEFQKIERAYDQVNEVQDLQKIERAYDQVNESQDLQKIERAYDQIDKSQDLQKIEGLQNQAVAIDAAALQADGCKVQSINVGKDHVGVESKCLTDGGAQAFLRFKGNDGVVNIYDDGSGPVAFKSIEISKQATVDVQYNSAMKVIAQTVQAVAVAHGYKRFGVKEKCNQFITEQGVKYEVFARVALSENNQPMILGYKIIQDKNGGKVIMDISTDSAYKGAFAGMLPAIHEGGCPLSEWVIVETKAD